MINKRKDLISLYSCSKISIKDPFFLTQLKATAREKGFESTDFFRKEFWPILLGITELDDPLEDLLKIDRNISDFTDQIKKDVDRSLLFLSCYENCPECIL